MAKDKAPSTLAKIAGAGAAVAAAWVAQRAVTLVWTTASGHRPPKPEEDLEGRFAEIAAAAAVTAAAAAIARVYAARGTARLAARVNARRTA